MRNAGEGGGTVCPVCRLQFMVELSRKISRFLAKERFIVKLKLISEDRGIWPVLVVHLIAIKL